jgi:hypothetical protein
MVVDDAADAATVVVVVDQGGDLGVDAYLLMAWQGSNPRM